MNDTLGETLVTRDYPDIRSAELKTGSLKWMFGALAAQTAIVAAPVKLP